MGDMADMAMMDMLCDFDRRAPVGIHAEDQAWWESLQPMLQKLGIRVDKKRYWKTGDGQVVKISNMDDKHLKNTLCYLDRQCGSDSVRLQLVKFKHTNAPDEYVDWVSTASGREIARSIVPQVLAMEKEMKKRGLKEDRFFVVTWKERNWKSYHRTMLGARTVRCDWQDTDDFGTFTIEGPFEVHE
jgi:hypothetical protein